MNVGFDFAVKEKHTGYNFDCFIFHDIDLLPESLSNLYGCFRDKANHLCDKYDKYGYKTQYNPGRTVSSGGIITVPKSQYVKVNGHPNRYWGWGMEDHEGSIRFRSYNASNDYLLERKADFMEDYILGASMDGGDIGIAQLV